MVAPTIARGYFSSFIQFYVILCKYSIFTLPKLGGGKIKNFVKLWQAPL